MQESDSIDILAFCRLHVLKKELRYMHMGF